MFGIIILFLIIIINKIFVNLDYFLSCNLSFLGQSSLITSLGQSSLIASLGYNIIYYYSVCQIKGNKLYNNILPYLGMFKSDNKLTELQTIELFDLDTNKNTIFTEKDKEIFELIQSPNNLLIMTANKCIDKKIIDKKLVNTCNSCFDVSKITFIALYLNYNDERYHIILKTEEFNYYLVGNIINKQFIQYYINNILKHPFSYNKEMVSYQLELMDQEVNMICLNSDQSIIIEKDNYRIEEDGLTNAKVNEKVKVKNE